MKEQRAEAIADVLSKCRGSFLAVALFSLFINLLMLMAPLYVLQIFDRVLTTESRETLLYLTVIAAVAFVTLGLLEGVRAQVLVRLSHTFSSNRGYTPMQFLAARRFELSRERLMREPSATVRLKSP